MASSTSNALTNRAYEAAEMLVLTNTMGSGVAAVTFCLKKIGSILHGLIDHSKRDATTWTEDTIKKVELAFENTRAAFEEFGDKKVDQIDKTFRNALEELLRKMSELEKTAQDESTKLNKSIQYFADAIPFANRQNSVHQIRPRFLDPNETNSVKVEIEGHFPFIGHDSFKPQIVFEGESFNATQITNGTLTFSIPSPILASKQGELRVPKMEKWCCGLLTKSISNKWSIKIDLLHPQPLIWVEWDAPQERKRVVAGNMHLIDKKEVIFEIRPSADWHFVESQTVQCELDKSFKDGLTFNKKEKIEKDKILWRVGVNDHIITKLATTYLIGPCLFNYSPHSLVTFTTKEYGVASEKKYIDLKWNESQVVDVGEGVNWKVVTRTKINDTYKNEEFNNFVETDKFAIRRGKKEGSLQIVTKIPK